MKSEKVKDVYKAAMMLKMQRVAEACSSHLASVLSPQNCLGKHFNILTGKKYGSIFRVILTVEDEAFSKWYAYWSDRYCDTVVNALIETF